MGTHLAYLAARCWRWLVVGDAGFRAYQRSILRRLRVALDLEAVEPDRLLFADARFRPGNPHLLFDAVDAFEVRQSRPRRRPHSTMTPYPFGSSSSGPSTSSAWVSTSTL